MITNVKVNVNQIPVDVLTEGEMDYPAISKIGQIFTADWKERLILAGRAFRMSIGTISGGGAHTLVGNGTTVDLDIPQAVIAVDSGYLIPMSLQLGLHCDADAENDTVDVLLTGDRGSALSAAQINTGTGTAETPDNLLDGAEAFSGRCESIFTVAVTDPTHSDLFYFRHWEAIGADELIITDFFVDKEFVLPTLLAGPCSLCLYFGGTVAVTGMGSIVFAHIPASWAPTS